SYLEWTNPLVPSLGAFCLCGTAGRLSRGSITITTTSTRGFRNLMRCSIDGVRLSSLAPTLTLALSFPMRAVIQRVTRASVEVKQDIVSQIGRGLLVLLGVEPGIRGRTFFGWPA